MPKVVIIGNSGAARECYWILQDMFSAAPGMRRYYEFSGFLAWKGYEDNLKDLASLQLGSTDVHSIAEDELFVIGVGQPALRKAVYETFKARGAKFMNLVHPWTDICASATLGEANIFQRGCTIYCNTMIGNGNYLNGAAHLSHDATIGDFNFLGPYSMILGGATLGSENHLSPHSVLLDHSKAGDRNYFAPGSFLYKRCKNDCRMAGNPALKIGESLFVKTE